MDYTEQMRREKRRGANARYRNSQRGRETRRLLREWYKRKDGHIEPPEDWPSVMDVACEFHVTPQTVLRWCHSGRLVARWSRNNTGRYVISPRSLQQLRERKQSK